MFYVLEYAPRNYIIYNQINMLNKEKIKQVKNPNNNHTA